MSTATSGLDCEVAGCDAAYCNPEDNTCYECFSSHCADDSLGCYTLDDEYTQYPCLGSADVYKNEALCILGEKKVSRKRAEDGDQVSTKIKHLQVGGIIRGLDANEQPTDCAVQAIGHYKAKPMYIGYTADHSILKVEV